MPPAATVPARTASCIMTALSFIPTEKTGKKPLYMSIKNWSTDPGASGEASGIFYGSSEFFKKTVDKPKNLC
jgi:hypothetical protein